ncbi:MAG: phosphoribosylaminoimidazolecarboxamide formyltransferase [Planctomycetota bacterium]
MELKYGCNPHQKPATLEIPDGAFEFLNGVPGYINMLDALGSWQLVRSLKGATGVASAASFKHVSPAGAAIARPLTDELRRSQMLGDEGYSPAALAYIRARAGDRMSSFGDVAAVSEPVDVSLARVLDMEVSDLIVAPDFEPEALEMLKQKKGGKYLIIRADPGYEPPEVETREVFGFTLAQKRDDSDITKALFAESVAGESIPEGIQETLVVATVALKYTQSNSVGLAYDGQVIGMGAGQQSRVHCTRLACGKAEKWLLQQHPKTLGLRFKDGLMRAEKTNVVDQYLLWDELSEPEMDAMLAGLDEKPEPISREERAEWVRGHDGVCLSSDAFIPFRDNIDRAGRTNVQVVAQPGGSTRDESVTAAATEYGMEMIHTGIRCFLH